MRTELSILTDNDHRTGFVSEHGFSLLLERGERRVLFDTGETGVFRENAQRLGKPLDRIDHLIISHSHHDHGGGVPLLFSLQAAPTLWVGEGFFDPKYSVDSHGASFAGVPFTREDVAAQRWQLREVSGDNSPAPLYAPGDGLWLLTGFRREEPLETVSKRFMREDEKGDLVPDTFDEEVLLVAQTRDGLVVIVGCSHPGIINMLTEVRRQFDQPVAAVIGGAHLSEAPEQRIEHTARQLREMGVKQVGLCHCTGRHAAAVFSSQGLEVLEMGAGRQLHWE